ncbi:MAG: NADAR family protein [Myxococcota bacterium]
MNPEAMLRDLKARDERGEPTKFLLFWGHTPKGPTVGPWVFSQWFDSDFEHDGDAYPTAEHFMMAEKARLFSDREALEAILDCTDPGKAKALGRRVRGFDEAAWRAARFDIVVRGNLAKFGQDDALRTYLLETGDRVLVEASPRDRIWGIGMGARNPDARHPAAWRGTNLLGFALMVVRDRLRPDGIVAS